MSERTHRHQLEKNVLADWLGDKVEALKPYSTQLAIGGIVLVAAIAAAAYYFGQSSTPGARGWQAFLTAYSEGEQKTTEALKEAAEKAEVKGTPAEVWALLAYADRKFERVAFMSAQDPQEAKADLAEAEKALIEVEKQAKGIALTRCRFALGKVYETQNKPEQAREYYQKVAETAKDTAIGKAAAEAARRLAPGSEAVQIIDWLAEQKPPERGTTAPGGNPFMPELGPGFGRGAQPLPERPNLDLPGESPFREGAASGLDFGRDDPLGLLGTPTAPPTPATNTKSPATTEPPDGKEPAETPADDATKAKTKDKANEKASGEEPAKEKAEAEKP